MLLALDTATPAVTVALHDGERVRATRSILDARRHGELLAPAVAAVLEEAGVPRLDVTAVAVGVGPGPFTGLRVGLVTARVLAATLQIPAYGVCTLDVLAAEAVDAGSVAGRFLVATDARRREVYWAAYDAHGGRLHGPHVDRPTDVAAGWPVTGAAAGAVVGEGALLYPDCFSRPAGPEHPDAGVLARVVTDERVELLDPEPLYLRRPDTTTPGAPKRVS